MRLGVYLTLVEEQRLVALVDDVVQLRGLDVREHLSFRHKSQRTRVITGTPYNVCALATELQRAALEVDLRAQAVHNAARLNRASEANLAAGVRDVAQHNNKTTHSTTQHSRTHSRT